MYAVQSGRGAAVLDARGPSNRVVIRGDEIRVQRHDDYGLYEMSLGAGGRRHKDEGCGGGIKGAGEGHWCSGWLDDLAIISTRKNWLY